ncbi:hypothetical protein CKO28_13705 [Rhodovibrio sodomensis]|uniref:Transposase n=1 Tax=Rhodovibrio sodomensis TaxID=1088 RepID=A0ABS1DFS9_9PROT|nr:hypothetical protein [Rhodovibrio sodomensis]
MPKRAYKYRIYPNAAQVAGLEAMLGAFCDLYNAGLQQRIEAWRRHRIGLRYLDQAAELKAVRAADDRLAGFSYSAEQQVLRRLNKAFESFFRRLKRGEKPGFPRFQAKSRSHSAEFRVGDGLTLKTSGRIGCTGIPGEIKVKWHRGFPEGARTGTAVLSRSAGKWYVTFLLTLPDESPEPADRPAVGLDLGLSSLVATSDGDTVAAPRWARAAQQKTRRLQRRLSRCQRRSKRRTKVKRDLARHHARVANRRRDLLHKLSRDLVDRHGLIAIEDLSVDRLSRSMLARSIHDAAWTQLRRSLEYKAESAGVRVIAVDPRGTSQICSACGVPPPVPKTLAQRRHDCAACGVSLDRDVNAARNILQRAITYPDQGPGAGLRTSSQRVAA